MNDLILSVQINLAKEADSEHGTFINLPSENIAKLIAENPELESYKIQPGWKITLHQFTIGDMDRLHNHLFKKSHTLRDADKIVDAINWMTKEEFLSFCVQIGECEEDALDAIESQSFKHYRGNRCDFVKYWILAKSDFNKLDWKQIVSDQLKNCIDIEKFSESIAHEIGIISNDDGTFYDEEVVKEYFPNF